MVTEISCNDFSNHRSETKMWFSGTNCTVLKNSVNKKYTDGHERFINEIETKHFAIYGSFMKHEALNMA